MQGLVVIMYSIISAIVVKAVYMASHDLVYKKEKNNESNYTKNIK